MSAVSESSIDSSIDFSDVDFRSHYDDRSYLLKTIHVIESLFKEVIYSLEVFYYRYISPIPQLELDQRTIEWNPNSKALFVFVHGLWNDPAACFSQLSILSPHTDIDIFSPVVSERGMCSLDQATSPLPSHTD